MKFHRGLSVAMASAALASALTLGTESTPPAEASSLAPQVAATGGWSALGRGMTSDTVFQIATAPDGSLYAGGTFVGAGYGPNTRHLARWNGTDWESVGGGVTAATYGVFAVAIPPGAPNDYQVWIGGDFSEVGGNTARSRLARWEVKGSSSWIDTPGVGVTGSGVEEIVAVARDEVYIGGYFDVPGDATKSGFVKFNGTALEAVGGGLGGVDKIVNGMAKSGDDIIIGGQFTSAGGVSSARVAKWQPKIDTPAWNSFTSATIGPAGLVAAIAPTPAGVAVGGLFSVATNAFDVPNTNRLAMWNGTAWVSIGTVDGPVVEELRVIGDYLYAGGVFTSIGGVAANNIARAKLDTLASGGVWEPLTHACTNGVNGAVRSIIDTGEGDGSIYVGGGFTDAGGVGDADRIAMYSPGAPACVTPPPVKFMPPPPNFRIGGMVEAKYKGTYGTWVHLAWDAPVGADYTSYRVTTRGKGLNPNVFHPDLTCETTRLTCAIYFPFGNWDSSMAGRQPSQVVYMLQGLGGSEYGLTASIGPLNQTGYAPATAPRDVRATTTWDGVTVSWKKPADYGSFGFATLYRVLASPGKKWCVARIEAYPEPESSTCTVRGLTPGKQYTFKVRAESLGRDGAYSESSNSANPVNVLIKSSRRDGPSALYFGGTRIRLTGEAPGFPAKTKLIPFLRFDDDDSWQPVNYWTDPTVLVDRSGNFSFTYLISGKLNKRVVSVRFKLEDDRICDRQAAPVRSCGKSEPVKLRPRG